MIDAHIHLDLYKPEERERLLSSLSAYGVKALVAVSMHLESARFLLDLKTRSPHPFLAVAFGYHPEQELPAPGEEERLFRWIRQHHEVMSAVGEVGLPYYLRTAAEAAAKPFDLAPYIRLLERFVMLAAELDKPIVLHAVYEDADIACDLLEKHGVRRAHFHWFKGSERTMRRMAASGYAVSITPDIVYKERTRVLAGFYPIGLLMAETDGPWPFEGPFEGEMTHPGMIRSTIRELAAMKQLSEAETGRILLENTMRFYDIHLP